MRNYEFEEEGDALFGMICKDLLRSLRNLCV
jgi:hypothetical protein